MQVTQREALARQNGRRLRVCLDFLWLLSLHQGKESDKTKAGSPVIYRIR